MTTISNNYYHFDIKKEVDELFEKAHNGDVSIIYNKNVVVCRPFTNLSPLHILATKGKLEILTHPDFNNINKFEKPTPFDILCNYYEIKKNKNLIWFIIKLIQRKEIRDA